MSLERKCIRKSFHNENPLRDITNGLHVDFYDFLLLSVALAVLIALSARICLLNNNESESRNTDLFSPFPILLVPYHARPNFLLIRSIYARAGCWRYGLAGRRICHVHSLHNNHSNSMGH